MPRNRHAVIEAKTLKLHNLDNWVARTAIGDPLLRARYR